MLNDKVKQYYWEKFGEPDGEAEFKTQEQTIKIFKWGEKKSEEEVSIYATFGSALGDEKHSCEFFIGLSPEEDNIDEVLAEVALHGNSTKDIPGYGDSVAFEFSLWPGTEMNSFLFTDGEEIIPPLLLKESSVKFIQLVPLFIPELEYKKMYGEEDFWRKMQEMEVPYWDPTRTYGF